ncbi:hypothetical protein [Nocardioides montaniterrae]
MIAFLVLVVLVVGLSLAGVVREARLDRPREIPRSRHVDQQSLPPAARRSA